MTKETYSRSQLVLALLRMAIAPILALSGLWAGLEMLPRVSAGFENLLAGVTSGAARDASAIASGDGDPANDQLAALLQQLRNSIADRLAAAGIDPEGLELEVDSVGTLRVVHGSDEIEPLLNGDATIRAAALDLVAQSGETRFSLA